MTSRRLLLAALALCLALAAAFAPGCSDRDELVGKYEAAAGQDGPVVLVLEGNGEGEWRVQNQSVTFTWEALPREIRLHTKDGGVIAGRRQDQNILVDLPGVGEFVFTRVSTVH